MRKADEIISYLNVIAVVNIDDASVQQCVRLAK